MDTGSYLRPHDMQVGVYSLEAEVEATFGVAGLVLENKSYVNSV